MSALREVVVYWEDQSRGCKMKQTQKKNNHGILYQNTFFFQVLLSHFLVFLPPFLLRVLSIHIKEKKLWREKRKNRETTREDNKSTKGPKCMQYKLYGLISFFIICH